MADILPIRLQTFPALPEDCRSDPATVKEDTANRNTGGVPYLCAAVRRSANFDTLVL
jgi:hypothetical protein